MAKKSASASYYIKLGSINYAWKGAKEAYPTAIAKALGVTRAKAKEKNLVFGANKPKPPRVRISLENGKTASRFCDPKQLATVLGGSIDGTKAFKSTIGGVGLM